MKVRYDVASHCDLRAGSCGTTREQGGSRLLSKRENDMSSIAKVIEVIAESDKSWDDAVKNALAEAARTVDDIKEIWVSSMKAIVENNQVVRYRLTAKITFVLKPTR
jgi:flavin-binding protein dodecin